MTVQMFMKSLAFDDPNVRSIICYIGLVSETIDAYYCSKIAVFGLIFSKVFLIAFDFGTTAKTAKSVAWKVYFMEVNSITTK